MIQIKNMSKNVTIINRGPIKILRVHSMVSNFISEAVIFVGSNLITKYYFT